MSPIDPDAVTPADVYRARLGSAFAPAKLPAGCDYQGRYPAREWPDTIPVQPAEAATEIGAEPCSPPVTRIGLIIILLTGGPLAVALIGWALSALHAI